MTYAQKKEAADNKLNVIASLDTAVRLLTNGADRSNPAHLAAIEKIELAAEFIRTNTDAQFWIDHRYDNADHILRQIAFVRK